MEKIIITVQGGDPEAQAIVIANLQLLLRANAVTPALEVQDRAKVLDLAFDDWSARGALVRLPDRFQFVVRDGVAAKRELDAHDEERLRAYLEANASQPVDPEK